MSVFEKGQIVEGYKIFELLGQGGMGSVWRAKQLSMDRDVALKVLSPELVNRDPRFCQQFIDEARAAGRLNHSNIVAVHDVGKTKLNDVDIYYFSMEVIEGEDCKERLAREKKFSPDFCLHIMRGMCDALIYAEARNIVHRDIKPENIMVTNDNLIKLADLGLATNADDDTVETTEDGKRKVMGTPRYMSPEQARGLNVDSRTDQYCLGATLFHFLAGRPPYLGDNNKAIMRAHVMEEIPDPRDFNENIPGEWAELCMRMLEKKPEERYPSAEVLREMLELVANGKRPVFNPNKRTTRKATHKSSSHRKTSSLAPLIIAAAIILVIAAVIFLSLSNPSSENDIGHNNNNSDKTDVLIISEAQERAQKIITELPDTTTLAIGELEKHISSEYFSGHPDALKLLKDKLNTLKSGLTNQEKSALESQRALLEKARAHIKNNELIQADELASDEYWDNTQKRALSDEYRSFLRDLRNAINEPLEAALLRIPEITDLSELEQHNQNVIALIPKRFLKDAYIPAFNKRRHNLEQEAQQQQQLQSFKELQALRNRWNGFLDDFSAQRSKGDIRAMLDSISKNSLNREQREKLVPVLEEWKKIINDYEATLNELHEYLKSARPRSGDLQFTGLKDGRVELRNNSKTLALYAPQFELEKHLKKLKPTPKNIDLICWLAQAETGHNEYKNLPRPQEFKIGNLPILPASQLQYDFLTAAVPTWEAHFDSPDKLRRNKSGLIWRNNKRYSLIDAGNRSRVSSLNEKDINTLKLKAALYVPCSIELVLTCKKGSSYLFGTEQDDKRIRLGINAANNPRHAIVSTQEGRLRYEKILQQGLNIADKSSKIRIDVSQDGLVSFFVNDEAWDKKDGSSQLSIDPQKPFTFISQMVRTRENPEIQFNTLTVRNGVAQ